MSHPRTAGWRGRLPPHPPPASGKGRGQQRAPALDIIVDSPLWKAQRGVKAVLQRAICEAASMATTSGGELAIVLNDDSAIRTLHPGCRGKDHATNVLSLPARRDPSASRLLVVPR